MDLALVALRSDLVKPPICQIMTKAFECDLFVKNFADGRHVAGIENIRVFQGCMRTWPATQAIIIIGILIGNNSTRIVTVTYRQIVIGLKPLCGWALPHTAADKICYR